MEIHKNKVRTYIVGYLPLGNLRRENNGLWGKPQNLLSV
jgi:hypothetical protein